MQTITGSTLYASSGDQIGEIVDIVGAHGAELTPDWITVKTGWLTQRLVPFSLVEQADGRFTVPCTREQVKSAPKVAAHVEPSHHEVAELCSYYGVPEPAQA